MSSSLSVVLLLPDRTDEGGHGNDLDGMEVFEVEEMGITGDNVVGFAF